jgi:type VI secretion system protein ImpE
MASDASLGGLGGGGGSLEERLARVQAQARQAPANAAHRAALFQLHCVTGAWDKAARQLAVIGDLDPKAELFCTQHRLLLAAEAQRGEVFAGRRAPACLGEPPGWMAPLVEAARLDGQGRHGAAKELREQAFAQAEATAGRIDDQPPFAWIADADERLGPVLEAIVNGGYWWIPFDRLRRVASEGPKDLKDLVWLPATFTLANGAEAAGFVPARYPGSEAAADDAVRLARRTEWREIEGGGSWRGLGQRMLATDRGEHPLLDLRVVELGPGAASGHG